MYTSNIQPVIIKRFNAEDRVITFVISTEEPDRDRDIIRTSGWDFTNYKKNPVFLWSHKYDAPPVGKAVVYNGKNVVYVESGRVLANIQFPTAAVYPFADTVFKLYGGGYLNGVSVGFVPVEFTERTDGGKEFFEQELVEISAAPIPSHPSALVEARSKGIIPKRFCPEFCDEIRRGLELCC